MASIGPVVPKQLNYADVLPVAIESRSNKRTFEPINGSTFRPSRRCLGFQASKIGNPASSKGT